MSTSSPTTSQQKPCKFLGAEYMGRKQVVRRSPNYGATISSIKQAFPKLRTIPADRIAISAFIEDLDDTLHISEHIWSEVLPDLKHITVVLDSADPDPNPSDVGESQAVAVTTDVERRSPDSSLSGTRSPEGSPAKARWFLPDTIPFQPYDWRGLDRRRI
ncbi:hypothetical protein FRC08_008189, partial [Ceratobasidium sp. 394]